MTAGPGTNTQTPNHRYTVILTFSKREVSMQLEGPDGDDIGGDDPPRWFADACEMACEHAQEEGQQ